MTHSQLEDMLGSRMREVTRHAVPGPPDAAGADRGAACRRSWTRAGCERTRIERGRRRVLATVFGKVTATRIAYRGTGVADLHPADAVLNLPAGMHSHGLAKLAAIEAARGSFAEAIRADQRR